MEDVNCLVSTLMGGDSNGWFDMRVDDGMNDGKKKRMVMTAADRILARASDRALGVVVSSSSQCDKKRKKSGWDSRSHVVSTDRMEQGCVDTGDEEDDSKGAASLVDWLSGPSRQKKVKEEEEEVEKEETATSNKGEGKVSIVPTNRLNKESSEQFNSPEKITTASAGQEKINDPEEEDKDDVEDGYIAL